ncbi:hypothetical protein LJR231_003876 [Phyllobacterium sp. LjRoot231]|uniref:hypothetical protein n=1 Tax=Phyllobacterium sp. LjRoot231 TaxID=3342289 RepID=UPI003ECDB5D7
MHKTLSAISAAMLGLAMLLTSAVSSFAAPISPATLQVTSNVEQVRDSRADWKRHHYSSRRDWRRDRYDWRRDRHDWRRDRYARRHWDNRRDYRGYRYHRGNRYLYGNGYVGKSWQ